MSRELTEQEEFACEQAERDIEAIRKATLADGPPRMYVIMAESLYRQLQAVVEGLGLLHGDVEAYQIDETRAIRDECPDWCLPGELDDQGVFDARDLAGDVGRAVEFAEKAQAHLVELIELGGRLVPRLEFPAKEDA